MTTAFVLSGGASFGAVQVGMLRALADCGISPDLLVGTSAGALNAAFVASRGVTDSSLDELAQVWHGLRARRLFRPAPRAGIAALFGHGTALCTDRGMRELIEGHLEFDRLEDSPTPLQVVATDLITGREVALGSGPAVEAILASSAIPGILPPVQWEGRTLVDGGLADNAAISPAVQAGADRIYVMPCGFPCAMPDAPRGAFGTIAQATAVLVHQRLMQDIRLYADAVDLVVFPTPYPISVNPLDFGHSDELIDAAYKDATKHLAVDGGHRDVIDTRMGPPVDPDLDDLAQGVHNVAKKEGTVHDAAVRDR